MTRLNLCALLLLTGLLLVAPRSAGAAEGYDNCTGFITSIPAVISTQGTWCLQQDLITTITSGNAIEIQTNNVTIDCNDFKLGGLQAGLATAAVGILANTKLNVTVRHCNIRGFSNGLFFFGSTGGGHTVEDNRFDGNTITGIRVQGDGSAIRRNRVFDTGESTISGQAVGIFSSGAVDILDNTVSGVVANASFSGDAIGIIGSAGRINNNGVRGVLADGSGLVRAIRNNTSGGQLAMRNNDLVGDASTGSVGLLCDSGVVGSAKDNVINGFATAITTCSDDGGNVIKP